MDCRTFSEIVADLDRGDTLAPVVREAALLHAEDCADCGMLLTESEALDRQMSALAASARPAPGRIEERLVREFRAEIGKGRGERTQWYLAALGTAAAAVFIASLFFGGRGPLQRGGPAGQTDSVRSKASSPAGVPASSAVPAQAAVSTPAEDASSSHRDSSTGSAKVHGTQISSNAEASEAAFIPLPYADSASQLGGGQVVRVIMTPEALASLGVRTNAVGATGEISADLLLDEDGTPEAIRLVAQADSSSAAN